MNARGHHMTTQTKFVIALLTSAALAGWGAYQVLGALFDPVIRSLGA